MTVREYAQATGIPEDKVRRMLRKGRIAGEQIPGGVGENGKPFGPHWVVMETPSGDSPAQEEEVRERPPRRRMRHIGAGSQRGRW